MKREASEEIENGGGGRAVQKIRHNSLRYSTLTHLPFAICKAVLQVSSDMAMRSALQAAFRTTEHNFFQYANRRGKQHPFVFCHELPKLLITSNHMLLKNVFMRCNVFSWRIWRLRSLVLFCEHRSWVLFEARSRSCSGLGKCRLHGKD